jgi:hypothetical protein
VVKAAPTEDYSPNLVIRDLNPALRYVDEDFNRDSKFVYTFCSIDAHGMTSNYSQQFEVVFDRFKNRLAVKRISASGAPKAYPNMFLLANTFLDSIMVQGYRSLKLVFDPQHYVIHDNAGSNLKFMSTNRTGGKYRIQFINTDLQKQRDVNIEIQDLRSVNSNNEDFARS